MNRAIIGSIIVSQLLFYTSYCDQTKFSNIQKIPEAQIKCVKSPENTFLKRAQNIAAKYKSNGKKSPEEISALFDDIQKFIEQEKAANTDALAVPKKNACEQYNIIATYIIKSPDSSYALRRDAYPIIRNVAQKYYDGLYPLLIECNEAGKGKSRDFNGVSDLSLEYAKKLAEKGNESDAEFYFNNALGFASKKCDNKRIANVVTEYIAAFPKSVVARFKYATAMSDELSPLYDLKCACKIFSELLAQSNDEISLAKLISAYSGNYRTSYKSLAAQYYHFLADKKLFEINPDNLYFFEYFSLSKSYSSGLFVEVDPKKSSAIIEAAWLREKDYFFMRSFEKSIYHFAYNKDTVDYYRLKNLIDQCLLKNPNDAFAKTMLGLVYYNGWGVKKDFKRAFAIFKQVAQSEGYYKNSTYKRSILLKSLNPNTTSAYIGIPKEVARFMLEEFLSDKAKLENLDEENLYSSLALAIIKLYDVNDKSFPEMDRLAHYFAMLNTQKALNSKPYPEINYAIMKKDFATAFMLSNSYFKKNKGKLGITAPLAPFYYYAEGVEIDKLKALDMLESSRKKFYGDNKLSTIYLYNIAWLWMYYRETGDTKNMEKMEDIVVNMPDRVYNSSPCIQIARAFQGDLNWFFYSAVIFKKNPEYTKYWLDLAENKEAKNCESRYSSLNLLIDIYENDPELKDIAKAEQIKKFLKNKFDEIRKYADSVATAE